MPLTPQHPYTLRGFKTGYHTLKSLSYLKLTLLNKFSLERHIIINLGTSKQAITHVVLCGGCNMMSFS